MFLSEVASTPPTTLTDVADIKKWLDANLRRRDPHYGGEIRFEYEINHDDMSVDVEGDVNISSRDLTYIPVKFGHIEGSFHAHHNQLTNFHNVPWFVKDILGLGGNKIVSFDGANKTIIGRTLDLSINPKLESLHNMHKHISSIGFELIIPMGLSNLLSIFFIKDLRLITISKIGKTVNSPETQLEYIISKHLRTKDVHKCQEELLEAGFDREARV